MRSLRFLAIAGAITGLLVGAASAQDPTYPSGPDYGDAFVMPDVSGEFNPMALSTSDVGYDGSGSVEIPYTVNQRATVWAVIYRVGSDEIGPRGPAGAWLRMEAQDLYIATAGGQAVESGSGTITWDGNDWEGNPAGAGSYQFDVVAVNNLDLPVLAGPGAGPTGFTFPNIDTSQNPPEIWVQEYERESAARGLTAGSMVRGTLGTDYLANPLAWERWSYNNIYGFDGARTFGGLRQDDVDKEIFYATHRREENGGVYKIKINRAAQSWDRVTDFGDNGFSINANGDRIVEHQPYGSEIFNALWAKQEVLFSAAEVRDKTTGEITKAFDVTDFFLKAREDSLGNEYFTGEGPGQISVTDDGIFLSSWGHVNILRLNRDGDVMWVNRNGDLCGDKISNEEAAAIGALGGSDIHNLGVSGDQTSNIVIVNASSRAANMSVLGRDGSCAFEIEFPASWGKMRPGGTRYNLLQEGSPYDGLYTRNAMRLETMGYGYTDDEAELPYGPNTLLYTPLALASGNLGDGATAVEEIAAAALPSSYELGDAYPNPFNPETTIEFTVPTVEEHVKVEVFNSMGQLVASLVDETLTAGTYKTTWDARDLNGNPVSSGVYFYHMQAGDFSDKRAMTLLK